MGQLVKLRPIGIGLLGPAVRPLERAAVTNRAQDTILPHKHSIKDELGELPNAEAHAKILLTASTVRYTVYIVQYNQTQGLELLMKPLMSILFVIAAAANMAAAGDRPDFSGNWKLDLDKSLFGAAPPPAGMTRTVEQKNSDILVKQIITGPDMNVTFTYATDGRETANSFMGTDFKSNANWDGKALVIHNDLGEGSPVQSTNLWTLSDDGRTFTDVLSIKSPDGNFEITYVLTKQ